MTEWCIDVMTSGILLGIVTYAIVWGMHNFDIFVDTVMAWADRQETFLQKAISCEVCLTVHVAMSLSAAHCWIFDRGLWTWAMLTAVAFVSGLSLHRGELMNERSQ